MTSIETLMQPKAKPRRNMVDGGAGFVNRRKALS